MLSYPTLVGMMVGMMVGMVGRMCKSPAIAYGVVTDSDFLPKT